MRVEWALDDSDAAAFDVTAFRFAFEPVAAELSMVWRLELSSPSGVVAIFVSRQLHCLADLRTAIRLVNSIARFR